MSPKLSLVSRDYKLNGPGLGAHMCVATNEMEKPLRRETGDDWKPEVPQALFFISLLFT